MSEKDRLLPVRMARPHKVGYFERKRRKRLLQKFYKEQEELLEQFDKDDQLLTGVEERIELWPSYTLFSLNIVLLFANLAAAILSGSLSIISTFVDTMMDLATSIIIGICLHLIKTANKFKYPRGRERLEILGVILCSVLMGVANMVIIMQSIEAVLNDTIDPDMNLTTLIILLSGCGAKIILMTIFFRRGTPSSKVLAMDMRNDVATAAVAMLAAFIGDRYWKYADPIGACIVCGLIALNWFRHALHHIPSLTGVRGEQAQLSRILKIAIEHDERIQKIDHLMIYHFGEKAIVEMHIVMNENLPLKITHDISHPLEKKLNTLEFVERSFVHCDYDCDGD